jgi:hypothetical protein
MVKVKLKRIQLRNIILSVYLGKVVEVEVVKMTEFIKMHHLFSRSRSVLRKIVNK